MLEQNEVKSMIEEGLKDVFSVANLVALPSASVNSSDEILETEKSTTVYMAQASNADGAVRVSWNLENTDFALEFSSDTAATPESFERVSLWRVNPASNDQRDIKSIINDFEDAIKDKFVKRVKITADGVKIPVPVSRSEVKNSGASFDSITLASRFSSVYPEYKEKVKENIAEYGGTFLPEEFFSEFVAPKVLQVIKNGANNEIKKLASIFNELYNDGTTEVQELICVTILGQLDSASLSVLDEYMDDALKNSVHSVVQYLNSFSGKNKKIALQSK